MPTIKQDLAKKPLKARSGTDAPFSLSHEVQNIVVSPDTFVQQAVGDCTMDVHTPTTYYRGGSVSRKNSITAGSYVNLTPSIATIGEDGTITRLTAGVAEVLFTESGVTRKLVIDLRDKADAATTYEFVSVVAGTLAEHAALQIDNLIDNTMTMGTNGSLYSTQDHATPTYVRNTNFWGASLDLTSISPWNSNNANRKAGTLVTPRHIIGAAHYEYPTGTVIRFVAADNTVVDRTVTGKKRHPDYSPYYPDLTIYTLDSDVPAGINFCKVMPSNAFNYISQSNLAYTCIPALRLDQEEKGLIGDLANVASFSYPVDADRLIFSESLIVGDSGNPAFLVVNGELVLVTVWTFGGGGSGTEIRAFISDINQMIIDSDTNAGVSTGYTLTEADFSSFPTV